MTRIKPSTAVAGNVATSMKISWWRFTHFIQSRTDCRHPRVLWHSLSKNHHGSLDCFPLSTLLTPLEHGRLDGIFFATAQKNVSLGFLFSSVFDWWCLLLSQDEGRHQGLSVDHVTKNCIYLNLILSHKFILCFFSVSEFWKKFFILFIFVLNSWSKQHLSK